MWEATYLPYGQEWNGPSGSGPVSPNHYKFTGKERDAESGLDYFGARYYASTQGRFTSPDEFVGGPVDAFSANDPLPPGPLPYAEITNPQSLNKYTYTWNNPLRYTDPDGHFVDTIADAVSVGYGLASVVASAITGSDQLKTDVKALAADVAGLVIPGVTGLGNAVRLANKVDNAMDAGKALDKAVDSAKAADKATDTGKTVSKLHGNTAGDQKADLYRRVNAQGDLQKHGVSQDASKRYSKKKLGDDKVVVDEQGPRREMLKKERQRVEKSPGPMNKEPWAGKQKPLEQK